MKKTVFLLLLFAFGVSSQSQNIDYGLQLLKKSEELNKTQRFDSAYAAAKKSLEIFKSLKNDSLISRAAIELLEASNKVHPEEQSTIFLLAKESAIASKDPKLLARTYYSKGNTLFGKKEFAEALPYFLKVDSIAERFNFKNETVVRSLLNRAEIARINFIPQTRNNAERLMLEALAISEEIKSEALINDIYLRLADIYGFKGELDKTKKYLDLAFSYFKKINNPERLHWAYLTYANYYYEINDLDSAEKKQKEGIAYLRTEDEPEYLASILTMHGNFYRKKRNNCAAAIPILEEAKSIYELNNIEKNSRYMSLVEGLAICNSEIGSYQKSSEYFQETYETKKLLVKKLNSELSRDLENKYQTEKKEQEIALLSSQKELAESQKKNQRNILSAIVLLITIAGIFLFFQYRNRQKTNRKLKELDRAKSTFFANISHEFRTPLTLINGPIEDQLASGNLSPGERKNLLTAKRSTKRLEALVEQLLALSQLESGNLKLIVQPGNLPQFINAQAEAFLYSSSEKGIVLNREIEKDECVDWFDRDILEKILFNLIGNALKYTPEKGIITIAGKRNNEKYFLTVSNTGTYISPDQQQKLFERFYQTDPKNPGTGIGLALTRELTELHHGSISLESTNDKHTLFTVELPFTKQAFEESEILSSILHEENDIVKIPAPETVESTVTAPEDSPILLIVDDSEDIRQYVKSIFEDTYQIHCAPNGKEGFEKALEYIPDIVLSDVMMPVEDGFALTRNIKENELTSHIPVILLTAKSQVTDKLEGMGVGADAYVTKPFNSQLLKATVANLIETRRKLQHRFGQEVILIPKDIAVSSADEQFLDRLQKVMDTFITDSGFTIEDFAREMGVSRMQLHRKLKALTGQTTTEFLRTQRLKIAANLLKTQKISISEVGYAVGFNDPSYFAKCFKQEFGRSPSDYV